MLKNQLDYGAVYAKVKALYGKRLKQEDYDALTRCNTVLEIATYLKEHTCYCEIFNKIDILSLHRSDLEIILRNEYESEYTRFFRFIDKKDIEFIKLFESRMNINEILKFLLLFNNGRQEKYQCTLPEKFLENYQIAYDKLRSAETYEAFLEIVKPSIYYDLFVQAAPQKDGRVDIPLLESALNTAYYNYLFAYIKKERQKDARKNIDVLLKAEIDLLNIIRILRLKRYYKIPKDECLVYMISNHYQFGKDLAGEMLDAPDFEAALSVLDKTPYGTLFQNEPEAIWDQKVQRYEYRINKKIIQISPPSIYSIISYLNLKEIEIHNLVNIIEGVRYHMPKEQIENYLIGYQS